MTGTHHDARTPEQVPPVDADAREVDERAADPLSDDPADETLPTTLDVPIDQPVEDVIESLQTVGDLDDDYEPHV